MSASLPTSAEIKSCCGTVYEHPWVHWLLDGLLHPGGAALSRRMGRALELAEEDRVLEIACGAGASAALLAGDTGCTVVGLDLSRQNLARGRVALAEAGLAQRVTFLQSDAEALPLREESFDAAFSECAFCTFPGKAAAAAELARALRPGGRLGLAEVAVTGGLPESLQGIVGWVSCLGGALSQEAYTDLLQQAGFKDFRLEDYSEALRDLLRGVRQKLLVVSAAIALGQLKVPDTYLERGKQLVSVAQAAVQEGQLGYMLLMARKRS